VIQLKAALNHAFKNRRVRYVPPLQHKTRDQVTPARSYRLSVEAIGEMLDYSLRGAGNYKGHSDRLLPFRRYLIGAICTLARPDAVVDMSVLPHREQWARDDRRFDLNPAGRLQTKKVRPIVPVVDLLHSWLLVTDDRLVCSERTKLDPKQKVKVTTQTNVASVRKAWDGASDLLKIPAGWGPKLIRHSMATILANRGVDLIQLEMALGHRVLGKTSSRYAIFDPSYLSTIKDGLEDVIADLTKMAGPALHAKLTQKDENIAVLRA
jgi:integrase